MEKTCIATNSRTWIAQDSILSGLLTGEIIQEYPHDKPYPSALILNIQEKKPLHIVIAFDEVKLLVYIITAYAPDPDYFKEDFKTRTN